jgi:hypothetical protein
MIFRIAMTATIITISLKPRQRKTAHGSVPWKDF